MTRKKTHATSSNQVRLPPRVPRPPLVPSRVCSPSQASPVASSRARRVVPWRTMPTRAADVVPWVLLRQTATETEGWEAGIFSWRVAVAVAGAAGRGGGGVIVVISQYMRYVGHTIGHFGFSVGLVSWMCVPGIPGPFRTLLSFAVLPSRSRMTAGDAAFGDGGGGSGDDCHAAFGLS